MAAMTESEFSELRSYVEAQEAGSSCVDMGHRPKASLISKRWLCEVVRGCWSITPAGSAAFAAVVAGEVELKADRR